MSGAATADAGLLSRLATQLGRFGLVGVANTLVDLAFTNLIFLLWRPTTAGGIALVTVIAGAIATVHSYVLNSRWTFRNTERSRGMGTRFLAFALLGIATQAAVTLFATHWWLQSGHAISLAMMNIAKLVAVVAAAGVTFVGYRVAVFTPQAIAEFRQQFLLSGAGSRAGPYDIPALVAIAVAVRLAFVAAAPVAYGDAINYSWVAWLVGHGRAGEADTFWHSAFDYWQALLVPLGLDQFGTLVAASLIPGVLLVVPGYLIALRLYGRPAALLAGLALALHPRLVEYSVNGYAETFFLHAALWATWGATVLVREPGRLGAGVVAGSGLAVWFLVRNEAVLAAALLCLSVGIAWWRSRQRPSARALVGMATAAVAIVSLHLACDTAMFGTAKLFSKGSNLGRAHVEMLDPREAARETYGIAQDAPTQQKADPVVLAQRVLQRWPRNFVYTLERLPGVLLSPLFLLALLLPAIARRRGSVPGDEWPLLALTVWPLLFYPLLQLEPRMLLPVVIGTCIFGAAALVAAGTFLARRLARPALQWAPAAIVLLALLPLLPVLARHTEAERGFHREVGAWLAANVEAGATVTGDGYGYVTASGFWAGRRTQARIWTDDSAALSRWVAARSPGVVILYERYLRESNPELLEVLDEGLPGLEPIHTFDGGRAGRVRVWRTTGQSAPTLVAATPGRR
jgi:putative flippase GtrA/4-amino-4-deoxy-L-arabinose transferase-like glycosyltransferase